MLPISEYVSVSHTLWLAKRFIHSLKHSPAPKDAFRLYEAICNSLQHLGLDYGIAFGTKPYTNQNAYLLYIEQLQRLYTNVNHGFKLMRLPLRSNYFDGYYKISLYFRGNDG